MDGEVRTRRVAAVFGVGLLVVAGTLYLWWPAGVVIGIVLATAATVVIGGRLQRQAETAPVDQELLDLLHIEQAGAGVTRTVLEGPASGRRGTSIR